MIIIPSQPVVYRGTISSLRISSVDGTAFLDNCAALVPYADGNHLVEIYDASGRMLRGYLSSVGSAEGLSETEKIANSDFQLGDTGFTKEGAWAISDIGAGDYQAVATNNAVNTHLYSIMSGLTVGQLFKATAVCSNFTDGSVAVFLPDGSLTGNTLTGTGTSTRYHTLMSTGNQLGGVKILTAGSDLRISSISVKQVLTPSTSGATIVSAKGGATQNFTYKNSSFTYNAASYQVIVRAAR